jgi:hypothetical protein
MMWTAGSRARATLLTAWMILMAVGIPLLVGGLWQFSSDSQFARAARSVRGTVLGKSRTWSPVEVPYDPDDPASNRLTASGSGLGNALFVLAGLVLTAAGGTGLVWTTRRAKRDARLAQHGVNTRATVTEINRVPLKVNDETVWRLRFEYQDDQGHRHAGAVTMSEEDAGMWSVGDRGIVRYDPARSSESVWMGRS